MKGKRNKLSSSKTNLVVETIMPGFVDKRIKTLHYIMELSMSEYNRMKKNSIHLSGYNVDVVDKLRVATYDLITYGTNVKKM